MYAISMQPTVIDAQIYALEVWGMVTMGVVGVFFLLSTLLLCKDCWNRRRKK